MASNSGCKYPHCEELADRDRKSGFCEEHTGEWIRSPEWRAATQDEKVRFWMGMRAEKEAMREVSKFRRKFIKRIESAEEA